MELQTMYPAKLGSPQTILAANLAADATSMVLNDASILPAAPNIAVIGSDENCEIVSYSSISDNTVTLSARGLGDSTAKAWASGSTVARNHTSLDHNTLKGNIEALNTGKAEADHNHDARYYTESEMDTKLAGKQNTLSWDTAPTSGGTNPMTSGAIYAHEPFKVRGNASAGSSVTFTDSRINSDHWQVPENGIYFGTGANVTTGVHWVTNATNHTITLQATFTGATAVVIDMVWFQ